MQQNYKFSDMLQVSLVMSKCWNHAMITGIAFADDKIATAAYNTDEMCVWDFDPL